MSCPNCPKCGHSFQLDNQYCAKCGSKVSVDKKRNLKWLSFLMSLGLVFTAFTGWRALSVQNLAGIVEGQLAALKANRLTEAYYEFASREFQSETSLPSFKELVTAYPVLTQNKGIHFEDTFIHEDLAILKGTLIAMDDQQSPVEYEMIRENNRWKILGILLAAPIAMAEGAPASAPKRASSTGPIQVLELILPIDAQLRSLRNKDFQDAYNNTSTDFRKKTTLEDFISFVNRYPALINHQSISVKNQVQEGNKANVTVELDPDSSDIPVQYLLVNENGSWKIWSMNVLAGYSPEVLALIKNTQLLEKPINDQLQALHERNIAQAYYSSTSKDFQTATPLETFRKFVEKYPVFLQYDRFEFKDPVISKTTGKIQVHLAEKNSSTAVQYTLGIEDNQWKIWGMQMLKESTGGDIGPVYSGEQKGGGGADATQFTKLEIGTQIDAKGALINPTNALEAPKGEIYLNLYVQNGKLGDKIEVTLKQENSESELPGVSTNLQQTGNSVISMAFTTPVQGWPKGKYQVIVTSATGVTRIFTFNID